MVLRDRLAGLVPVRRLGLVVLGLAALGGAAAWGHAMASASGESAEVLPLVPQAFYYDVASVPGHLVAVGERGHILVSANAGASWTQASVPTRVSLTGVALAANGTGFAVGHDAVVLRTRDFGLTWDQVFADASLERPWLDVWTPDGITACVVGAYGNLLVTSDGGATWEARQVHGDDDFHLNAIAAAADGTMYLAGEGGHLYRSDDHGATWQPLRSPYAGSWFGASVRADGRVLVYGLRGHAYQSSDKGATWTQIPTGTEASLTCAFERREGGLVLGGLAGAVVRVDTTGVAQLDDQPDRKAVMGLLAGADEVVLRVGEGGIQRLDAARSVGTVLQ